MGNWVYSKLFRHSYRQWNHYKHSQKSKIFTRGTDGNLKLARFHDAFSFAVDDFEGRGRQAEADTFRFTWFERNSLKAAEIKHIGGDAAGHLMEVELDNFVTLAVTCIPDVTGDGNFPVGCDFGR